MAQLALLNPEVCGSSPVFGKKLYSMFTVTCIGKTKLKKKEVGNDPFKNELVRFAQVVGRYTYRVSYACLRVGKPILFNFLLKKYLLCLGVHHKSELNVKTFVATLPV